MDILQYIQRINQLYGSEQQVAGLSESFPGTFTSYHDAVSNGFQGTQEEWLQQQSIPQIDRPLTGAQGGRVYDTRKYFKPGGLVEPGVTHYAKYPETRVDIIARNKLNKYLKGKKEIKDSVLRKKLEEIGYKNPKEQVNSISSRTNIKIIRDVPTKVYKSRGFPNLDSKELQKATEGLLEKWKLSSDDFEKLTNAERSFVAGRLRNLPNQKWKTGRTFESLPEKTINLLKAKYSNVVSEWNFDKYRYGVPKKGNTRIYDRLRTFVDEPKKFKYWVDLSSPGGWMIAQMDRASMGSIQGEKLYKPIYRTVDGNRKIAGFIDNSKAGGGKKYFAAEKWIKGKDADGLLLQEAHPDFKNTKKFYDIASKAHESPSKVITDILRKGGVDVTDKRLKLNHLLNYLIDEKGVDHLKRAMVMHHEGGVFGSPTQDYQILNKVINQKIKGIEDRMRLNPENILKEDIAKLKKWGASVTIDGKTYGGGPRTAIGGEREIQKLILEGSRDVDLYGREIKGIKKWEPKEFKKFNKWLADLCPGKASGGRVGFQGAGSVVAAGVDCGKERMKRIMNGSKATSKELSTIQKIMRGTGAFMKGLADPRQFFSLRTLLGPEAMLFYAGIEGAHISYDHLAKGVPWKEALAGNWMTAWAMPWTEQVAQIQSMREKGMIDTPALEKWATGIEKMAEVDRAYSKLDRIRVGGFDMPRIKAQEAQQDNITKLENEFMSWMDEQTDEQGNRMTINALISPTSAGNVEFQRQLTEKKATELASTKDAPEWVKYLPDVGGVKSIATVLGTKKPYSPKFGKLGAEELPPRITERIGPRKMGVVKEELKPLQQRFDLPKSFADVSTTPLSADQLQEEAELLRNYGYLEPREGLPEEYVKQLQSKEKWRQLSQQHGFKPELATGGRVPFLKGKLVDEGRRKFMKWLAGITGAGIAAGTGLIKWGVKKGTGKTVIKAGDHIITSTKGMPDWYIPLINRIVKEGDDVTKKLGTIEREIVHTKKISAGEEVTVYQDLNTGNVRVEYGPHLVRGTRVDAAGKKIDIYRAKNDPETVHLEYKAPEVIEEGAMKGKKTKSEFSAAESEPEVVNWDGDIEWSGINEVNKVDDLVTDTSSLKQFAKKKLTHRDKVVAKKKQKYQQKLQEDTMEQIDYIEKKQGSRAIEDYVKEAAERGDLHRGADVESIGEHLPTKTKKASGGSVDYDNYLPDIDNLD
jgi:hypothetical protein